MDSICIVKWGKTLSLCGVNSFIFLFSFWLREVRIDLVRTSTILLHVTLVPKIQPASCYIPKIQISCSQNWRLHNPRLAIPKLQHARKLPPAAKSRHAKSPSNPEPKGPLVQIGGGYFCNTPYILDKRVPKSWFTPSHRLLFAIRNPRPP